MLRRISQALDCIRRIESPRAQWRSHRVDGQDLSVFHSDYLFHHFLAVDQLRRISLLIQRYMLALGRFHAAKCTTGGAQKHISDSVAEIQLTQGCMHSATMRGSAEQTPSTSWKISSKLGL